MIVVPAYASAWRPQDRRSRSEWASCIRVPNMARGEHMDIASTRWQMEPVDMSADNRVREMVVMWPTGAGKSNFIEAYAAHSAAEDTGDILLGVQGDAEAKKYVDTRLVPGLKSVPELGEMLQSMGKHAAQKFLIKFPHMVIHWGGTNLTHAQATSVRTVIIDEAWMADHGLLQQFRARLHDRWNGRFIVLGQGGEDKIEVDDKLVDTEWQAAWLRTDRREWNFKCPECGEVQRYWLHGLRYERGDDEADLDELAVIQSARYQCIGVTREKPTCDAVFTDDIHTRRSLSSTGRYVATNPKHRPGYHGWHMNALGLWYVSWGTLAVEHAVAHRARKTGDEELLKTLRQKRMAENYRKEEALPPALMILSDYSFRDYADEQEWPGEIIRIMAIDVQRVGFWCTIRAWKADGSSRLLWCAKVNTWEALRELQQKYKVKDPWVMVDCQHRGDDVFNHCAEFNTADKSQFRTPDEWARQGWTALQGDKATRYKFVSRSGVRYLFHSKFSFPRGTSGNLPASHIFWSSLQIKRILERFRGGLRHPFEVPRDINDWIGGKPSESYLSQMFGDVEVTSAQGNAYFKKCREHNHFFDCEAMGLVGAILANILRDAPSAQDEPEEKVAAAVNA